MKLSSRPASLPGGMTISEAKARVENYRRIASRAVPVESVRLNKAADDLAGTIALVEKQTPSKPKAKATGPVGAPSLIEAGEGLGLSSAAARTFAAGRRFTEAVVKNVAGLSAACFAFVPDPADPTTWQLQICRADDSGNGWTPDQELVKAAVAQLPGIAGYGVGIDIPLLALPAVKSVLRSAWIACTLPLDEMPPELAQEALRKAFVGMGLSDSAAATAAKVRGRR